MQNLPHKKDEPISKLHSLTNMANSKAVTRTMSRSIDSEDSSEASGGYYTSSDDPTTTHATSVNHEDSLTSIKDKLSKKESQDVFRLRLLVFLVLIVTAAAVSYVVFHLTAHGESDEFRTQYLAASEKILACK